MNVVVMTLRLVDSGMAETRQRCDCAPASHHDDALGNCWRLDCAVLQGQGLDHWESCEHLWDQTRQPGRYAFCCCSAWWVLLLWEGKDWRNAMLNQAKKKKRSSEAHASRGDGL